MKKSKIAVIGAGSWGTAIAGLISQKKRQTYLWSHNSSHIKTLVEERENKKYLSGFILNERIVPTDDLESAVKDCDIICMVIPSHGYRSVFQKLLNFIHEDCVIVSAVKGIENDSLMTMTQLMEEELEKAGKEPYAQLAVLSGPSFAQEVASRIPTAVTIGCRNLEIAKMLQNVFGSECFRVYASSDVIGLEISAAFKNIIAIATGICEGLGYGLNTRAALITRGLAEITRLGMKMKADPTTFSGLSGLGDLVLTCTGDLSRNRTVGVKLGQGKRLDTILSEMNMVAEGVKTTLSGYKLAQKYKVDMPILEQTYQILYEGKGCSRAVKDLLKRQFKVEY